MSKSRSSCASPTASSTRSRGGSRGRPAWSALRAHRARLAETHLRDLFAGDAARAERYVLEACGLRLDYSKNRITDETLALLLDLAGDADLEGWIARMFAGERINTSEDRAVLHVALRQPGEHPFPRPEHDVMPEVRAVRRRMGEIAARLRDGSWRGASGEPVDTIVHVGIGGSHLGPAMAVEALGGQSSGGPAVRFVSGLDPSELHAALAGLEPARTLFVVVSKSFSTQECLTNATSARTWLLEGLGGGEEAVANHFLAVTAETERALAWGIPRDGILAMWDWVGGRYSLCSAVSLSVVAHIGMAAFEELLEGAHAMDRHFREAPPHANMPVLLGLLGIWYRNFFDAATRAVLPYDHLLRSLPRYLQQLEMESNGKRVGRDGEPVDHDTCPVVWGAPGNDGQHAFYQLLHQGTELVPADIVVPMASRHPLPGHEAKLIANALAQAQALMTGRTADEVAARLAGEAGDAGDRARAVAERVLPGNQPSNLLLYHRLTPRVLGALIALYEHRTFVQGVCWGINSFDQWGVELGKELASQVLDRLQGAGADGTCDASTAALIEYVRAERSRS